MADVLTDAFDDINGAAQDPRPPQQIIYQVADFLNGTSPDMDVNGAGGVQNFLIQPPVGEVWYLEAVSLYMQDPGANDANAFGAIAGGITNGLNLATFLDSNIYVLSNFKNNMDLMNVFVDKWAMANNGGFNDSNDTFNGSFSFQKPIQLTNADLFGFQVQDNLTSINFLRAKARYWRILA